MTKFTHRGQNNTYTPHMTDLQREKAGAPWERVGDLESFAIKAACWMIVVLAAFVAVSFA